MTGSASRARPKIAFYTRISTNEKRQKHSLAVQRARMESYCTSQHGDTWELFAVYRDTGSGSNMDRPALRDMLYFAERKAFDTCLVFRIDRLSRRIPDLAKIVEYLDRWGITLRSIMEPFDTSSAAGRMMVQMLGIFAEFEYSAMSERVRAAKRKMAEDGHYLGSSAPAGYVRGQDGMLTVHPEEASIVKRMFQYYALDGLGTCRIARKLNEAGFRKRDGTLWSPSGLQCILKNRVYVGHVVHGGRMRRGKHQPIVGEDLFFKAQEARRARTGRRKRPGSPKKPRSPFPGMIRCGQCGGPMSRCSVTGGRTRGYYGCLTRKRTRHCDQAYVNADFLEQAILADLRSAITDGRLMALVWSQARRFAEKAVVRIDRRIARVRNLLESLRQRIGESLAAFEKGIMSAESCDRAVGRLQRSLRRSEAVRRRRETYRDRISLPPVDNELLAARAGQLDIAFLRSVGQEDTQLMRECVYRITVRQKRFVELWLLFPRASRLESLIRPGKTCDFGPDHIEHTVYFRLRFGVRRNDASRRRAVEVGTISSQGPVSAQKAVVRWNLGWDSAIEDLLRYYASRKSRKDPWSWPPPNAENVK